MVKSSSDIVIYAAPVLVAFIVARIIHNWLRGKPRWPKGPPGLPLLGYVPFLGRFPYETFHNLHKRYGPIFTVQLFATKAVIVNDLETIKKVLSRDEVLARPEPTIHSPLGIPASLLDGSSDLWREQRRFALQHLRDHGYGRSKMEDMITEEIGFLAREIEKRSNELVNITKLMTPSVSNNICILVFGKRFDYDDPRRVALDQALSIVPPFFALTGLLINLPWLAAINYKFNLFGYRKLRQAYDAIWQLLKGEVAQHEATLDDASPRDYIDSFLVEQHRRQRNGQEMGNFNFDILVANATSFFLAGSETIRTTIVWSLMLMVKHKDVQDRVQAELDYIVGPSRSPAWDDRVRLPYTMAVLMETHRWASTVPLSIPRRALSSVVINGVTLPEGATVIINLWSAHHDSKVWNRPEAFNPLNFYDESSKTVINKNMILPFSYGKRNCVGENMAQVELFLYFATIMQKFNIDDSQVAPLSFRKSFGVTLQPESEPLLKFNLR